MDDLSSAFNNMVINESFTRSIWSFNPEALDTYSDILISKYCLALSQYLIYFISRKNVCKANIAKKKYNFERLISLNMSKDVLKLYSTKKDAQEYIIASNPELETMNAELMALQDELIKIDGIEEGIIEYIATFKREMTRRERELQTTRYERR